MDSPNVVVVIFAHCRVATLRLVSKTGFLPRAKSHFEPFTCASAYGRRRKAGTTCVLTNYQQVIQVQNLVLPTAMSECNRDNAAKFL